MNLLTIMHTPIGRVRWLRLPFGISSAPEEFQRKQREVLEGLEGVINIADDILIYGCGDTQEEADKDHDKNLIDLLERCRERNLKLNPEKLKFRLHELPFMGHKVTTNGLKPDESKIEAITSKAVLRFLGMCKFLAQYIPRFSEACAPLREISNSTSEFSWANTQQAAFTNIKQKVTSACALQYFDPGAPVTLQVDASNYSIGVTLLQKNHPVAYAYSLTTLTKPGKDNYAQIEKECLATVHAMTRWDQWLYGHHHIVVESDHKPLETIFKHPISHAPKRLQKMMLHLQRYTFTIVYRKGSTLSRAPLPREQAQVDSFEVFVTENIQITSKPERITDHTHSVIQRATQEDPILSRIIPYIQHGWPDKRTTVERNQQTTGLSGGNLRTLMACSTKVTKSLFPLLWGKGCWKKSMQHTKGSKNQFLMPSTQCTGHQCKETSRKLVNIVQRVHSEATNTNQSPCYIIPFQSYPGSLYPKISSNTVRSVPDNSRPLHWLFWGWHIARHPLIHNCLTHKKDICPIWLTDGVYNRQWPTVHFNRIRMFCQRLELQAYNQLSLSQPGEWTCRSHCESCQNILRNSANTKQFANILRTFC